jgi:hypothetical protein
MKQDTHFIGQASNRGNIGVPGTIFSSFDASSPKSLAGLQ